ncbi:MAG TPA: hypothetical protein VGP68_06970 [Gemmataceae bacterium]|jgi:hypothetical protein|nr:hypothetical protein [Gemmataceae bacterium]
MSGRIFGRFLALGLVFVFAGSAFADRLPSVRTSGQKMPGYHVDITVPYLDHGKNAFQGYSVAPQIKASPTVSDQVNPGAKPVYNLPFYGAKQAFGSGSNGAVQRPNLPPSTTTK